ncbi:4Fe-4S binding domain-containing protein [Desulfotomaculum arcticum]|uniref:4Fe-4S binding domain-containing protein n=1 Tax=Desulfotruncus arcticus DSM 17038 TaxID=1121424 RepID=A0A1I2PZ92_9FIRM|nr:4Fe-4S binding protein [Desulfotruncus arcticus]SFG21595.1 4Fe-4S binding domain-containing protein [Desulfotomaculum arcticum] [Desulfotruncus arcticus DSM 17038]
MFDKTGVATPEMLKEIVPSEERRKRGPYAVFECFQKIPCNPCQTSCKFGAVAVFQDINNTPQVDFEKCTGCGVCVSNCPGLAISIIDETYSENEATIKIPYELLPLPMVGQVVDALDREGQVIGKAQVIKVQSSKALNKTNAITIAVPKDQAMLVRNIGLGGN